MVVRTAGLIGRGLLVVAILAGGLALLLYALLAAMLGWSKSEGLYEPEQLASARLTGTVLSVLLGAGGALLIRRSLRLAKPLWLELKNHA